MMMMVTTMIKLKRKLCICAQCFVPLNVKISSESNKECIYNMFHGSPILVAWELLLARLF